MPTAAVVVVAYLVGSIPTGAWLARLSGTDIRSHGSGNTGATNVARTLGMRLGIITLISDILKGLVPATIALLIGNVDLAAMAGTAAVVGHTFSIFLGLRGGKGVATALGVFLILAPWSAAAAVVVFAATFAVTRTVSLGSILGSTSLPLTCAALDYPPSVRGAAVAIALLIVWRHRENLDRLLRGQEGRFEPKGR